MRKVIEKSPAIAIVEPCPCRRQFLATCLRLRPPPFPVRVFADEASAREWLEDPAG